MEVVMEFRTVMELKDLEVMTSRLQVLLERLRGEHEMAQRIATIREITHLFALGARRPNS